MAKTVTANLSILDIGIPVVVLVLLFCPGCDALSGNHSRVMKLELANCQAELDLLKKELDNTTIWKTRQQKTVNDYAKILMRQGVTNYQDHSEWKKKKYRAEAYSISCIELENKITRLEQVRIPEIENALQETKGR